MRWPSLDVYFRRAWEREARLRVLRRLVLSRLPLPDDLQREVGRALGVREYKTICWTVKKQKA
jgi:hypothetical protein